uniref:Uncharacterized protein n=1 Tax=Nelumbo nucifera TaxID=4432 RepID=A0A822XRV3_NELNU|nr:TPA_asm: hypothetical protein HUJ06_021671 [Nelumbo nucifera]
MHDNSNTIYLFLLLSLSLSIYIHIYILIDALSWLVQMQESEGPERRDKLTEEREHKPASVKERLYFCWECALFSSVSITNSPVVDNPSPTWITDITCGISSSCNPQMSQIHIRRSRSAYTIFCQLYG